MPILYDNSADTSVIAIPPVTVDTPKQICLKTNVTLIVCLDGVPCGILQKGCREFNVAGELTFKIDESCCGTSVPVVMTVGDIIAPAPPADPDPIPGVDCTNPSNVSLCELNDLLSALTAIQTAIENQEDYEIITSSWICDEAGTGNWIRTVTPYIDGVAGADQTVDSGIPCSEPQPLDFEVRSLCDPITGTVHLQTISVAQDGTITLVDDLDTLEVCGEADCNVNILPETYCYGGGVGGTQTVSFQNAVQVSPTEARIVDYDGNGNDIIIVVGNNGDQVIAEAIGVSTGGQLNGDTFNDTVTMTVTGGTLESLNIINTGGFGTTLDINNWTAPFAAFNVAAVDGFSLNNMSFQLVPNGTATIDLAPSTTSLSYLLTGSPGAFLTIESGNIAVQGESGQFKAYAQKDCVTGVVAYYDCLTHVAVTETVTKCEEIPIVKDVEVDTCDGVETVTVDSEVAVRGVVTVKQCPEDVVTVDVEVLCNDVTDVWEYHVFTTTNGVTAPAVVTATTIPCDEDQPDFEIREECNALTSTLVQQLVQIDEDGTETDIGAAVDTLVECNLPDVQTECVESQEWTYGLDNTGTSFANDNTIQVNLSDGTFFVFNQPPAAGWTPQMAVWGAEIQAAADASGLAWFVETRFRDPSDPASLVGGGGFAGPPSVAVSNALSSMAWRYVNIQICPGQPTPVSAEIIDSSSASQIGFSLTTDGPVKGPIQKFIVCRACGETPVWYLEDGVTLAAAGQIPNCYEPCGTLALTPQPPEGDCTFQTLIGCDNNNSALTVDFTQDITRRAQVCNGEQISVDYFQADPLDPNALVTYTLVGQFVDCATGEAVPLPENPCSDFNTIECPPYEVYPKPITDGGRDLTLEENDLFPLGGIGDARNFAPWDSQYTGVPPFPVADFTDVAPATAVLDGFNPGADNLFRTRVFDFGLSDSDVPQCADGTPPGDVELNLNLQITGNHLVGGTGDDIFIYILDGASTAPVLLDTLALVGAPLLGTNIYSLSATVSPASLDDLRLALSLQTLETVNQVFNWDIDILEVGITIPGCELDCVQLVHDECASNQRKSGNDLLYQIAQNTRPVAVVVEEVVPCSDFVTAKMYQLAAGTPGEWRRREWNDLGPAPSVATLAAAQTILAGFPLENGMPTPLLPDTDVTGANNANVNDSNNTGALLNFEIKESYVVVNQSFLARYTGAPEGYQGIFLGECCGDVERIYERSQDQSLPGNEGDEFAEIPEGIHFIRVENLDTNGTNSSANFEVSLDGGQTWGAESTAPWTEYSSKPVETCIQIGVCKDTREAFNLMTDEVLDKETLSPCPKSCAVEDTSVIDLLSQIVGSPDDECPCANVEGCLQMEGFDYYELSEYTLGQTTSFDVIVNGTTAATTAIDFVATSDGTGKASWYPQLIAAVNANSNFTMAIVSDAAESSSQRPVWSFSYSGPGNETLAITENGDVRTFTADANGDVTGIAEDNGNPFGTDPFTACP